MAAVTAEAPGAAVTAEASVASAEAISEEAAAAVNGKKKQHYEQRNINTKRQRVSARPTDFKQHQP